jgi:hypothetical protein
MGRWKADRRLNEVQTILRRLQHIANEPDAVDLTNLGGAGQTRGRIRLALTATVTTGVAALGLLATYGLVSLSQPMNPARDPPPQRARVPNDRVTAGLEVAPPPPPPPAQDPLQNALQQLANGRIQAARGQLIRMAAEGSADAAWSLARSYDPTYLGTIPEADAAADVEEATRWYQTWHTLAVKEGLVADSISLQRIIGSMRQPPTR